MLDKELDKVFLLERGKKGLQKVIFGRTILIFISFVIQFALMFAVLFMFSTHIKFAVVSYFLFVIVIELIIINKESNPEMKISWIVITLILPVVGGVLYLYVQLSIGTHKIDERLSYLYRISMKSVIKDEKVSEKLKKDNENIYNMSEYLLANGNYRVYQNTRVKYFSSGEDKFEKMLVELEKAKKFIFLEYFIICEGYMWGRVLNILRNKVKQGVEVRVMYDGFNTLTYLPVTYPAELEKLGIKCKVFSPIKPVFSTLYNNRDHRKLLIIDGHTGFTGGINLADEYINQKERFGHWKDTAVMLKGEAVQSFTQMFLHMWNITEKNPIMEQYLKTSLNNYKGTLELSKGYVIPYGDSPFDSEQVGEAVYLDMINRADRYIYFMTPYLILDHNLTTSLCLAAKKGVDVRIILPHIPDKFTAFALAKTHYKILMKSGIKIYEYTPGFIHAKVALSDDIKAVVGTINLDYRSLYFHFENAVYLYKVPEIQDIKKDFKETFEISHEVTIEDVTNEKLHVKITGILLKIIAPLM